MVDSLGELQQEIVAIHRNCKGSEGQTRREKITLFILLIISLSSFAFLAYDFYTNNTNVVPAFGGKYVEGVVGQPRFINPIYGETDDTDKALINLVFSGLMKYDDQGKVVPDLVEGYTISNDGKIYNFQLKNNIYWQDGKPLTADDIVFTIKTIQNSDYKSPLRANWLDVDADRGLQPG